MKKLTKAQQAEERQEAINTLLIILKPNTLVYTKLDSVSSSGMSRQISVYVARVGDEKYYLGAVPYIQNITYWVAKATGHSLGKTGGIKIGGCGMDMGFALVYNLGRAMFPEGFKVEGTGRNGDTSGHDRDGGYALKQSWL